MRLTKRNSERELEQALKAYFGKKNHKQTWLESNKKCGGGVQKPKLSNYEYKKHKNVQKGNKKFDKRNV